MFNRKSLEYQLKLIMPLRKLKRYDKKDDCCVFEYERLREHGDRIRLKPSDDLIRHGLTFLDYLAECHSKKPESVYARSFRNCCS